MLLYTALLLQYKLLCNSLYYCQPRQLRTSKFPAKISVVNCGSPKEGVRNARAFRGASVNHETVFLRLRSGINGFLSAPSSIPCWRWLAGSKTFDTIFWFEKICKPWCKMKNINGAKKSWFRCSCTKTLCNSCGQFINSDTLASLKDFFLLEDSRTQETKGKGTNEQERWRDLETANDKTLFGTEKESKERSSR